MTVKENNYKSYTKSKLYKENGGRFHPSLKESYIEQGYNALSKITPNTDGPQRYWANGGLFQGLSDIENPVMNLLISPRATILNILPLVPTVLQQVKVAYLTGYNDAPAYDITGTVCEDCPTPGNDTIITSTFDLGRVCFSTRTANISQIIAMASRAEAEISERLFFVGDVRGVSGPMPVTPSDANFTDVIRAGVMRREFHKLALMFERLYAQWLYIGDKTSATQNTNPASPSENDKWRSFWGLEHWISNQYATYTDVTGTATEKSMLNSVVFDWTSLDAAGQDAMLGKTRIYELLEQIENVLYNRALGMGYSDVETVLVMRPHMWQILSQYLPIDMLTPPLTMDGQPSSYYIANNTAMGPHLYDARNGIRTSQRIILNGRTYNVLLDHFIPYTDTTATYDSETYNVQQSDIYFLNLRANGLNTLEMWHMDYSRVAPALQIPNGLNQVHGWHDNGRFLSVVSHDHFCFNVTTQSEFGLFHRAPQLCARITDVRAPYMYGMSSHIPQIS